MKKRRLFRRRNQKLPPELVAGGPKNRYAEGSKNERGQRL